jgi:hypothetical protein
MPNLKPYRTKVQKKEARRTARKDKDGAWRSNAPFSIHGTPGEWIWDPTHKFPVRKPDTANRPLAPGDKQIKDRNEESEQPLGAAVGSPSFGKQSLLRRN